jgi:hypothetical protein
MLATAPALTMPITLAVLRREEERGDSELGRRLRGREDLIHATPVVHYCADFALIAAAVVWH